MAEDGQVVSKRLVENDIIEANRLSDQIEEIADRQVAHLDPKGTEAKVTFDDLRTCLDYFDKLAVKYIRFFTGTSYAGDTMKARLVFDMHRVFGLDSDWESRSPMLRRRHSATALSRPRRGSPGPIRITIGVEPLSVGYHRC